MKYTGCHGEKNYVGEITLVSHVSNYTRMSLYLVSAYI